MTWSGFQRSDCDDFFCAFCAFKNSGNPGVETAPAAGLKMLAQIAELNDRWDATHPVRRAIATGAHSLVLNASWNSLLEPDAPIRLSGITHAPILARYDHAQHALIWDAEIKINDVANADWHLEAITLDNLHLRLVSTPVLATTPSTLSVDPSATTERGVRLSSRPFQSVGSIRNWANRC